VTIDIGANDMFLCQETTQDHRASAAELQTVLQEIQANPTAIYTQIRDVAHYPRQPVPRQTQAGGPASCAAIRSGSGRTRAPSTTFTVLLRSWPATALTWYSRDVLVSRE
jgi:hypothetical protein